jgi:hypothetical protein
MCLNGYESFNKQNMKKTSSATYMVQVQLLLLGVLVIRFCIISHWHNSRSLLLPATIGLLVLVAMTYVLRISRAYQQQVLVCRSLFMHGKWLPVEVYAPEEAESGLRRDVFDDDSDE